VTAEKVVGVVLQRFENVREIDVPETGSVAISRTVESWVKPVLRSVGDVHATCHAGPADADVAVTALDPA
jgi:hypothetical protein